MDIKLLRVDSRLLHGQVALTWARRINPDRIIIVSDGVANDELRKTLITQAAPTGITANVTTLEKFITAYSHPSFEGVKAIVIFENVTDLAFVLSKVPDLGTKTINIGGMAHSEGKTTLNKAISIGEKDVEALKAFKKAGFETQFQMVPADSTVDVYKLAGSKGFEI